MHRELQGTRILKSSRATPYRQTVIIINIFSLNYMMCVKDGWEERGREKDKQTKEEAYVQEGEGGRDTPDEYGSECEGVG